MQKKRIFDELMDLVPDDAEILNVHVGIFWTFVQTQYGSGISATAHRWLQEESSGALIPDAGNLIGLSVKKLSPYYDSPSLTTRALALASVSASFPAPPPQMLSFESGQSIVHNFVKAQNKQTTIALVGHFHFADALREAGHRLLVFELDSRCEGDDIPASRMPELLGQSDIVAMTSSTLLTHATEDILSYCRSDAYKLILGPSVPMHPAVLEWGVDAVCGSLIEDPVEAARIVSQGGNHKQIWCARKCVMRKF